MKRLILVDGSGFLGQVLGEHFRKAGFEIVVLTRSPIKELAEGEGSPSGKLNRGSDEP